MSRLTQRQSEVRDFIVEYHVERGYIGDVTPAMLRSLRAKAMFYLKIESPNGRCGFMRLTPLGEGVQATIKARAALRAASEASQ